MRAMALIVLLGCSGVAAPAQAAWPSSPYVNLPVSVAANSQTHPVAVSDGSGGMIVVWEDSRSGSYDLYAQRISADGVALWAANGVALCTATNDQFYPSIASDGLGGAVVAWHDERTPANVVDIYAQRINSNGVVQWTANGVPVCVHPEVQDLPQVVTSTGGGAIVVWQDLRGTGPSYDVYAQRLSGVGAPQWAANGAVVCGAVGNQFGPMLASDGIGGAIIAWTDARSGTGLDDVYGQRVANAGNMLWTANGVPLGVAAGAQRDADIIADGSGGAIVVWSDQRVSTDEADIYGQRVAADGARAWGASGSVVNANGGSQLDPRLISDAQGGAIVVWQDGATNPNVNAQRVNSSGHRLWAVSGVVVCAAAGDQSVPSIVADGSSGAIVAWADARLGPGSDVFAQRVSSEGATLWTSNGVLLAGAAGYQDFVAIVGNGDAGALVAWTDERAGTTSDDVYAQRVERYGQIGQPEPTITSVRDVANDQGGALRVAWDRSPLDADPTYGIVEYRLWRSAPVSLAATRAVSHDADEAASQGLLLVGPFAAQGYSWQLVATQVADALPTYELVTATTGDSTEAGNPLTVYMVEARASTSIGGARWYSQPDSGYSVDDLAPPMPAPFTGDFTGASTYLTWGAVTVPDLAGYRLYRGTSIDFVLDASSLVATLTETHYEDAAGTPYYYKLVAVDVHGNASPIAKLLPDGVLDAPGGIVPRAAFLAPSHPSPAPSHSRAVLRFGLTRGGPVALTLHDSQGRLARTLARGEHAAGEHVVALEGHALAPGVYLARLEAPGVRLTRRVVIL